MKSHQAYTLLFSALLFTTSDGRVSDVKVTKPSPLEGLNSAAVESMLECQFTRLLKDGEPAGSSFLVTWIFSDMETAIRVSD